MDIKTAIENGEVVVLQELLTADPGLANSPIRWGKNDEILTQPLHFVCDKVFDGTLSGERAALLARALIEAGAEINHQNGDPLNAAASLGATEVGLLLLDAGARPDLRRLFGEMPLHWAATIGNAVLVQHLLERGAPVDAKDKKWDATPIGWALHGWGEPPPPLEITGSIARSSRISSAPERLLTRNGWPKHGREVARMSFPLFRASCDVRRTTPFRLTRRCIRRA